jgi:hypothetical protein
MSKQIEIRVIGYGQEIVQGVFTDQEVEILEKKMEELDFTLGNLTFDLIEYLPESGDWYDRDELTHTYGAFVDDAMLEIIDGDKEITIDNVWDLEEESYSGKVTSEEVIVYDGSENVITTTSNEKGWIMSGIIELKEGQEFDTSKLEIKIVDIFFNNYENSLINEIIYDGEHLDLDADTIGKSFESYLEKKSIK